MQTPAPFKESDPGSQAGHLPVFVALQYGFWEVLRCLVVTAVSHFP
jgi:hypothetical protein